MPIEELCGIQAQDDVKYDGIQSTKQERPRAFLVAVLHGLGKERYGLIVLGSCV